DDPTCPTDRSNLIWGAAEAVWRAADHRGALEGVLVRLKKRIPMMAGLGGGSSDAAAALRGCGALWRVKLSSRRLREAARKLGADVPYFLEGGTALGLARGDRLRPLDDLSPAWVLVAVPAFGISTKDAYRWWDEDATLVGSGVSR